MPLYDNFDVLWAVQPGGVGLRKQIQEWSDVIAAMDRDDVCGAQEDKGWSCIGFGWSRRVRTRTSFRGTRQTEVPHGRSIGKLSGRRSLSGPRSGNTERPR